MIVCHLQRLFEKNSCLPFESERKNVWQIQYIQGLNDEYKSHSPCIMVDNIMKLPYICLAINNFPLHSQGLM
jgi:hypothetical protein